MKDISLHILDLVQNSISASASLVEIYISEMVDEKILKVCLNDNGKGMSKTQADQALDPFFTTRTTRKVGLGLPLFKAQAEASGGSLSLSSQKGKGTKIKAIFKTDHIDCLPLGNMADTIVSLILCNPELDFIYRHIYNGQEFTFNTMNIKAMLDEISITKIEVITWIKTYIGENLKGLYGGVSI